MAQHRRRTGGRVLVDQLLAQGVEPLTCVPGESYLAVLDGLWRARGGHGERVERSEEFAPAFGRALASGRPAILHCIVDPRAPTPTTTLDTIRERPLARRGNAA